MITFISDGSTITIDPEAGTAVSSDADGPHSRNMVFSNRWNDYQTKIAECGNDVEAIEKCRNENIGALFTFKDRKPQLICIETEKMKASSTDSDRVLYCRRRKAAAVPDPVSVCEASHE